MHRIHFLLARTQVLALVLLLVSGFMADSAMACCDVLPSALNAYPGSNGQGNTPFAVPGQLIQLVVRPDVCDEASSGLDVPGGCVDPENLRASFLFFDQSGSGAAPSAVVLADKCEPGSWGEAGAQTLSGTCLEAGAGDIDVVSVDTQTGPECRLNLRLPDTGFSGPARIFVDRDDASLPPDLTTKRCAELSEQGSVCYDELFNLNGTCDRDASNQRETFSHFVALPTPNDYKAMIGDTPPPVLFTTDKKGNVLAPVDWSGVLFQGEDESFPPPQLVNFFLSIGSGLDVNGSPAPPGVDLEVPGPEALSSFSPFGQKLPPIVSADYDETVVTTLFGTTDAQLSVIRVQRLTGSCVDDPIQRCISDASCATGSCDTTTLQPAFDLSYCISQEGCIAPDPDGPPMDFTLVPSGPGIIIEYEAEIDGFVPLENLNVCREVPALDCLLRDESLPVRFGAVPDELSGEQFCDPVQVGNDPICADRNADQDIADTVVTLRDSATGQSLALSDAQPGADGVAAAAIHEAVSPLGPFAFDLSSRSARTAVVPGLSALGEACVAMLVAEPDEGIGGSDLNLDDEIFDPVLRVYCPGEPGLMAHSAKLDGLELVELAVLPEPSVLGPGRTLSLSKLQPGLEAVVMEGGKAVFLLDEPGNANHIFSRADVLDAALGGGESSGISDSPALGAAGDVLCFRSTGQLVDSRDKNKDGFDVFCHEFSSGETFVVNRFQEPPRRRALCEGRIIRANGDAGPPSVAGAGERIRVCYDSPATNLVKGDQNKARDIFLLDRCSCETVMLSVASDGSQLTADSTECALAADGSSAVFTNDGQVYSQGIAGVQPEACDVGPDPGDELGRKGLVPVSAGVPGIASVPTTSGDGSVIAFQADDGSGTAVYVKEDGAAIPSCLNLDGDMECDLASNPHLSPDGRLLTYEAFDADAGANGVFVLDRLTGLAEAVGSLAGASSDGEAVTSAVAYTEDANPDVVLRSRWTMLAKLVEPGTRQATLSEDGRSVAYTKEDGVYVSKPDAGDSDAIIDGASADQAVLMVLDLETGDLQKVGPAVQAAVSGSTLAHIAPNGQVFVNGAGPLALLGGDAAVGSAVAVSDDVVCVVHEDSFVYCGAPGAALQPLDVTGDGVAVGNGVIAVLSLPTSPQNLSVFSAGDLSLLAGVPATRRFQVSSNGWVGADSCAAGDPNDPADDICFAVLIDPTGATFPVEGLDGSLSTIVPCTADVCDSTQAFKLFPFGDTGESVRLRYLTVELQQGSDLNGDGDLDDVVVREFVPENNAVFAPTSVSKDSVRNVLAGTDSQTGAAIPAEIGFCRAGPGPPNPNEPDTQIACQSDQNCLDQGVCGEMLPCCVDIQSRVLGLFDTDGDGVFDIFDNCPTVSNPEQLSGDGDGDGVPDSCDDFSCGDGVVQNLEYCDYADVTVDPITGQMLGSFCTQECTPVVGLEVSESAVNPDKNGILPTTVFGSPVLNLGVSAFGDRPPQMIEPSSIVLEPLEASAACGQGGAMSADDLTDPGSYQSRLSDKNGDGFLDLGLRFEVQEMGISLADTEACLTGSFRVIEDRFFEADFEVRDSLNVK